MDFLYKDENKRMNLCEESQATHVLLTIEEYNSKCKTNQNMHRILKEKQNASRGIQPKKQRSGYILLGYDTNKFRLEFDKETIGYDTRRLLLETPYPISLNYKSALELVMDDMAKLAIELGAFTCISKESIANAEIFKSFFNSESEKYLFCSGLEAQRNGIWAVRLHANYTPDIPPDLIKQNENNKE